MNNEEKFQTEYNFEGKLMIKKKQFDILTNPNSQSQPIKNYNINNSNHKLILDIEAQNYDFKDQITITPIGLEGSQRIKSQDEKIVYFGCELYSNQVINRILIY